MYGLCQLRIVLQHQGENKAIPCRVQSRLPDTMYFPTSEVVLIQEYGQGRFKSTKQYESTANLCLSY